MPELAEVESSRAFISELLTGNTIEAVCTREQGGGPRDGMFDDLVFEIHGEGEADDSIEGEELLMTPIKKGKKKFVETAKPTSTVVTPSSENRYHDALVKKTLKAVHRKGKQLWFEMVGSDVVVLFHFGMTGSFVIENEAAPSYKSFRVRNEHWPPKFAKLEITFSNNVKLAFCDPRRLGRIRLRTDPLNSSPIKDLGIDPVIDGIPPLESLLGRFARINTPIKTLLLDQNKIFCGIGNWLADEILFQARIHPDTAVSRLNEGGVESLRTAMKFVLDTAVSAGAQSERFPKDWLFHYRWSKGKGKGKGKGGSASAEFGHHIVFETVAGRTSAIVPSLQHKNGGEFCRPLTAPLSSLPSAGTKVVDLASSIAEEDSSGSNKNEIIIINNDSATTALTRNNAEKKRKRK